jgi:hypothetical protein
MFMGGLALAGIGWALGYITASSLVTAAFSRPEFTRQQLQIAQMIMDICVLTSLAAGWCEAAIVCMCVNRVGRNHIHLHGACTVIMHGNVHISGTKRSIYTALANPMR